MNTKFNKAVIAAATNTVGAFVAFGVFNDIEGQAISLTLTGLLNVALVFAVRNKGT